MDREDRKALDRNSVALEANTAALEQSNKLTSAVLKASGKQPPRQPAEESRTTDPFRVAYGS